MQVHPARQHGPGAPISLTEITITMMQFDATLEMAKVRHQELIALARQQPLVPIIGPDAGTTRRRFGRTIIRTGQWLQGCRPEDLSRSTTATF